MRTIIFIFIGLFFLQPSNAHPSWAFLIDEQGCIYLVDLMSDDGALMYVDVNKEELTVLATGFHGHSMHFGADGHIYAGLNIWRQGEIEGEGHNYLIRINTRTQDLDTLLFSDRYLDFFGADISMSDDLKTVYYNYSDHIYAKTLPSEPTRKLIDHTFERPGPIAPDLKGNLWIADVRHKDGALFCWNAGEGLHEYATGLIPRHPEQPVFKERRHHIFFGLSFSLDGHPIITESAGRKAVEVLPNGKKRLIYQSPPHWHPLMVRHHKRKYYVLENGWKVPGGYQGMRIRVLDQQLDLIENIEVDARKRKVVRR